MRTRRAIRRLLPPLTLAVAMVGLLATPTSAHETIFKCRSFIDIGPTAVDATMCVRVNEVVNDYHEALTFVTKDSNPAGTTLYVWGNQNIKLWLDNDGGDHSNKQVVQTANPISYYVPAGSGITRSTATDTDIGCDQWQGETTWRWQVVYPGGNFYSGWASPLISNWTVC